MRTWSGSRWALWAVAALAIAVSASVAITAEESGSKESKSKVATADTKPVAKKRVDFTTGSSDVLISFINEQIRQGWTDNEIEASEVAGDGEWVRRVYLDIVGHVPPMEEVEKFLADKDKAKRSKLIDTLLDDPGYVRHWTNVWANLMIGQDTPRRVSRKGMEKFLREAFTKNRPWNDVVMDIVSAEGHFEENGAVNFLLAQMVMPDDGVLATAKTTRLFLGMQVQCTQCHNHPFNDWQQRQFWEFNNFFRQLQREDHRKYDAKAGRMVDDYSELIRRDGVSDHVTYEKRNGLIEAAYPRYFGKDLIDEVAQKDKDGWDVNRREVLAKLMIDGEKPLAALAMVNRMWSQFFGYGITKPVDDMGPHNPPSHPDLLDRLGNEFVKSRYDVKQLIRWICNSEAYNLTSQASKVNEEKDNPAAGTTAMFSHVYLKSMSAEQLYDSLIVATNAHKSGRSSWEQAEDKKRVWLRQFVVAFGTDEGDESTTFNGSIPQALMMMNGDLVKDAISAQKGSFLNTILAEAPKDTDRIRRLYLTALGRAPSPKEAKGAQDLLRVNPDKLAAYQDMFWALLNSNEFIFIH
ncbi:MAG: DUF1549 domain-containing protein [Planctomycetes bacterium]|nr:DUF1549 domain-containing protein [Planctomycetota bacterium]